MFFFSEFRGRNWNVFWDKYILFPKGEQCEGPGFCAILKGIFRDYVLSKMTP